MSIRKALAALPLVVSACDSGGDDPAFEDNEPGQGIWTGGFSASAISSSTSASGAVSTYEPVGTTPGEGLYNTNGDMVFYTDLNETVVVGDSCGDVAQLSTYYLICDLDVYQSGSWIGTASFSSNTAAISTNISGSYSGTVTHNYVLAYDSMYYENASLANLNGTWLATTYGEDWNLIISSGLISGSGPGSCNVTGSVSTIDTSKNEYAVSANITDCANSGYNKSYQGMASTISDLGTHDVLMMGLWSGSGSGNRAFYYRFNKQ